MSAAPSVARDRPRAAGLAVAVGARVRLLRTLRRASQLDLADAIRTSRTAISSIESGRQVPGLSTIARIAAALDVPIEAILIVADAEVRRGS